MALAAMLARLGGAAPRPYQPARERIGNPLPRIAITGHMNLTASTAELVRAEIDASLARCGRGLTGVSCLARGADSIFAQAILDAGGQLEVILPAADYRQKVKPEHAPMFDALLAAATAVHTMPFAESSRDAYVAANEVLLGSCDLLLAVWDGENGERGGTATVVTAARQRGLTVLVIWPAGAARAA